MKKFMGILFVLLSMSAFAIDGHLRLGGITNSGDYNGRDTSYDSYAPTVGFEVKQSLILVDVGAGIAYNGKTSGANMETVPAYLMARYNIIPVGIKPYLVGKVGKVLYTKDDISGSNPDGSYYYAAGAGVEFLLFQAELLYSITKIDDDKRGSDDLKQVSMIFGIQLF